MLIAYSFTPANSTSWLPSAVSRAWNCSSGYFVLSNLNGERAGVSAVTRIFFGLLLSVAGEENASRVVHPASGCGIPTVSMPIRAERR
jgi:hypothetical protein